jgi:TRAP-type mannitol/chloroaromatic compound transport system permease large subunit
MYKGALLPGIALASLYALFVFIVCRINPAAGPGLPPEEIGHRKADGTRGLASFWALAGISSTIGTAALWNSGYSGMEFFILALALTVLVALAVALANRAAMRSIGRGFLSPLAERVTFVMVPPLMLIFLVLGTILVGVATPTEGGAMGAVGALLLAGINRITNSDPRRLNWGIVRQATEATAKLSAFVMFILIGARIFSLTFYGVNGHIWVEHLLTSLPGGMYGFLIAVMLLVFLLAFFLDFFELAFILVPLLKPAAESIFRSAPEAVAIAKAMGFAVVSAKDPSGAIVETVADVSPFMVWFGILLAVNMQTSFMHPPFGFALFYLRSVAPKEPYTDKVTGRTMQPVLTSQIYWGAVPYVGIQLFMVAIVMALPWMAMHAMVKPPRAPIDPAAIERSGVGPGATAPGLPAPRDDDRFALPPTPPAIEGAPPDGFTGAGAPTLDMRELPRFD